MDLTLQIYVAGDWHDAVLLSLPDPAMGRRGKIRLDYEQDYALQWLFQDDEHACCMGFPVEIFCSYGGDSWPAFIDDILPSGASRRYWVNHLGLQNLSPLEQDGVLLHQGVIAPIGNLRIKESLPVIAPGSQLAGRRFSLAQVRDRDTDFLEYAQQMGAASGGATGAGGEAPKLVLRCSAEEQVWIDTYQDDQTCPDRHYLVKFPRGQRTPIDCDILRAEYHYYQELAALGIPTIDTAAMRLEEGARYPSLWLPRFDVAFKAGQLQRYGLESVYSLLNKPPGSYLSHLDVLAALIDLLSHQYLVREGRRQFDPAEFAIEWVKRDMLNVVFGNSDNHGRNVALLKTPEGIGLSPVFDFAPMKADPEGVVRTIKWPSPLEEGGNFNWWLIADRLKPWVAPDRLLPALGELANRLLGLRERLHSRGVPPSILGFPSLGFPFLDEKILSWKLP